MKPSKLQLSYLVGFVFFCCVLSFGRLHTRGGSTDETPGG